MEIYELYHVRLYTTVNTIYGERSHSDILGVIDVLQDSIQLYLIKFSLK